MVVPIAELNRPAWQSLAYASSLAPEVVALHLSTESEEEAGFRSEWERWLESRRNDFSREAQEAQATHLTAQTPEETREATKVYKRAVALAKTSPQLVVIESPYRSLMSPLVAYIDALRDRNPGMTVMVVLPEFVPAHWWERLLHNQTAFRLKLALYSDPRRRCQRSLPPFLPIARSTRHCRTATTRHATATPRVELRVASPF